MLHHNPGSKHDSLTFPTRKFRMVVGAILLLLSVATGVSAKHIEQTWVISNKVVSPDGVSKLLPVVNGQFPGPDLRGHVGDTVQVTVINKLPAETTSIHWHGIKQTGTPFSDGVPGVTQCPIGPGESFVYKFKLTEPGTLWWHSHSAFQKSSLYGAIVITGDENTVDSYDEEETILLNDWYHASGDEQLEGLNRPRSDFKWVGDAQSLLFNGVGVFDCDPEKYKKPCPELEPGTKPFELVVDPGRTYRLRLVGASSLSFLNFNIDAHKLKVVEVETTLVRPFETSFIDIGSGQSYSVLLRTKSVEELRSMTDSNGLFYMQLNVRHRDSGPTGLAILRYRGYTEKKPLRNPPKSPDRNDVAWSLKHARSFFARHEVPLPKPARTLTILGTQNELPDGRLGWGMNNISYAEPGTPALHAMALGLQEELEKYVERPDIPMPYNYSLSLSEANLSEMAEVGTQVFRFRKDEVVDIVFQNTVNLGAHEEVHPWHLHLHNFWVLGFGEMHRPWTIEDEQHYDTKFPVSRNTFTLYPGSWTAIRVRFDNPGTAHFHCHLLAHLGMGMGFLAQIGEASDLPPIPQGTQFCGTVTKLMAPPVRNPLVSGGCRA